PRHQRRRPWGGDEASERHQGLEDLEKGRLRLIDRSRPAPPGAASIRVTCPPCWDESQISAKTPAPRSRPITRRVSRMASRKVSASSASIWGVRPGASYT